MNTAATSGENFILGDLMVIDPDSSPRFDEAMTLKEDYDLTAQHLHTYGKTVRSNRVVIRAAHYTNAGGAVADRTTVKEQYNIAVLRHKWPGVFPQHTTRGENEVNMRWSQRSRLLGGTKDVPRPMAPEGYTHPTLAPEVLRDRQIHLGVAVGSRLQVKFAEGYFPGTVRRAQIDPDKDSCLKIEVLYDDGDIEEMSYPSDSDVQILPPAEVPGAPELT